MNFKKMFLQSKMKSVRGETYNEIQKNFTLLIFDWRIIFLYLHWQKKTKQHLNNKSIQSV